MEMKYNLEEVFKKQTGNNPISPGIDIYREKYIKWLEEQNTKMIERLTIEYKIASSQPPDFSLMERLSRFIERATGLQIDELLK